MLAMQALPLRTLPRLRLAVLWLALVTCDTGAQLAFKSVALRIAPDASWRWVGMLSQAWLVWAALACMGATFLLWMAILRTQKLSSAFPVTALTFVTVAIASHVLYGEDIAATTLAGMALIVAGVTLLKPLDG
jgi:multidrug transporter EmrE-like cation transporter